MKNIKLVRLTSGEEILVNVIHDMPMSITVTDPVLLIPDAGKIGFMPYMSYCEMDSMVIKKDHIMFNLTPTDDLKGQYTDMIEGTNKIQLNETPQILV